MRTRDGPDFSHGVDVYLDESGETGTDFLNQQQSVHVAAGWIVPRANRRQARGVAREAARRWAPSADELKASKLLNRARGRAILADLLPSLSNWCHPVLLITNKHYAVAAKIVETFIDPPVNNRVDDRITWDTDWKRELAESLNSLPAGSLTSVWEALREEPQDLEVLRQALSSLTVRCELRGQFEVADLLTGALPHIDEVVRLEAALRANADTRHTNALAVPTFASLCSLIDLKCERLGMSGVAIIHDRAPTYERGLRHVFRRFRDTGPLDVTLPNGNVIRHGYVALERLRFMDSRREPLIQAADAIAGIIRSCVNDWLISDPKSDLLRRRTALLLHGLLVQEPTGLTDLIADRNFMAVLGRGMSIDLKVVADRAGLYVRPPCGK